MQKIILIMAILALFPLKSMEFEQSLMPTKKKSEKELQFNFCPDKEFLYKAVDFDIIMVMPVYCTLDAFYITCMLYGQKRGFSQKEWQKIYNIFYQAVKDGNNFPKDRSNEEPQNSYDKLFCHQRQIKEKAYTYLLNFVGKTTEWQNNITLEYKVYIDLITFKYLYNYDFNEFIVLHKSPYLILRFLVNQPGPLNRLALNALLTMYIDEMVADKKSKKSFFQSMQALLDSQDHEKSEYARSCIIQYRDKFNYPTWFDLSQKKDEESLYQRELNFIKPQVSWYGIKKTMMKPVAMHIPRAIEVCGEKLPMIPNFSKTSLMDKIKLLGI